MEGFLSVKEATKSYAQGCKAKAATSIGKLFGKAMLAGMMIGMGAAASSVAAHSVANVGLARLTAAVVFPVGLMMVILLGAELFTGDCLMALGVAEKHISVADCIRVLVLVFLGNFAGALIFTALVYCSGQLDYSAGGLGAYTIKVAYGKATLSFGKAFTSGILCNILVCAAVLMAICAKDISGKLLVSFFVIMLFVTAGFEHCVANMYYITAGLFCKMNPDYVNKAMELYGYTEAQLSQLSWGSFLIKNLIPVTLGNSWWNLLYRTSAFIFKPRKKIKQVILRVTLNFRVTLFLKIEFIVFDAAVPYFGELQEAAFVCAVSALKSSYSIHLQQSPVKPFQV